tara:strand:+ start:7834 stop:8067 length:234 start_codon:yes stop_codon:yes gene_type:complete
MSIKDGCMMEFKNFLDEVCEVLLVKLDMDDSYIEQWVTTPNPNLNMEAPIDVFNKEGMLGRLSRLLYFIEIGEADVA